LEEEVEFGSDEDLIDGIGEIILPQSQAASVSGSGGKQNGKSKERSRTFTSETIQPSTFRGRKKDGLRMTLADAQLVIDSGWNTSKVDPGIEPKAKKKGLFGSLRSFGKQKDEARSLREGSFGSRGSLASAESGSCGSTRLDSWNKLIEA
jgi:hypothetical protein